MTRHQRADRAKRVQKHHEQLRETYIEFGRKPYRCTQEQIANRRAAIGFGGLFVICLVLSIVLNQPVLALFAFLCLTAGVLIAKDA